MDAWDFFEYCRKHPSEPSLSILSTIGASDKKREVPIKCNKGSLGCPTGMMFKTLRRFKRRR